MRMKDLYAPTLKETPSDVETVSHEYLLRGGFIRKVAAGIYTYLPLGRRVLLKIENIVREEMNRIGAQEILMPILQPAELWKQSGRWDDYGPEMMKLKDRHERDFTLGPTHEEIVTDLVKNELRSYKQLPLTLYQIANKYRDEIRPRFGLLRAREFIMKDAYSFHASWESLDETYEQFKKAYSRIMERLGVRYMIIEAETGAIGGNASHEFVVPAKIGETNVLFCEKCGYQASDEKAEYKGEYTQEQEEEKPLKKVPTPGVKTIEEVSEFLGVPPSKIVKSLLYKGREGYVMVLIRGDLELNEAKLKAHLKDQSLRMATPEEILKDFGVPVGFIGPIGVDVKKVADHSVRGLKNFVVGGMEEDTHYVNANHPRDFKVDEWYDLRTVVEGDPCPVCGEPLKATKGIELGHIFKLGTKYSEAMKAYFMDENGEMKPFIMGCYGWGVSRTMAAVVEHFHDENGMIWPLSIAPYTVVVDILNMNDAEQKQVGEKIYQVLSEKGEEVVLDDREVSPGFKFKDADLIGFPIRINVGRSLKEGVVELKKRYSKELVKVNIKNGFGALLETLEKMKREYDPKEAVR
ncbi:prolyl-tRNA synthetase [Thermotoga maritima MSB8]|uniref:Proline--tRNA ligase n=1 Tax=Thermotoga maritima (strain ATCC 43589 / DSM 3109 / JCM 10099 / NBRC 100826 / MSB8) TaxID=243274 RepID=SYP_THEMA|nr:proline--tRNA ligase [Thermotoga maritima]Q9WYY4.1 RecName: Full=Proline--tRNA ligase; AltName: Full=Prolyl-tRNA synthetase; Short=ProRS [Thermotoga maritima MSB8]AAD35599.1 prolyl-tRNA synthetase [Thermotoga maritima MSB8]AGL49435.1 Prolyl-tRNA synthetase [Thermotoga maritima MSB8]AHD17730.1 prolyl-tRNA synthetase [Thermotoga maritima MSB8]AKE26435.1 prolyl-tRNA synthetase [Thermotoga maritima]AKE28300.1 prolyl-tRNA synthetase [Thermotoga maritima MSB8]